MKDIKPVFEWARANGDANIYDRIFVKVMPQLLAEDCKLTSEMLENVESFQVSEELYEIIVQKTQELIGAKYV